MFASVTHVLGTGCFCRKSMRLCALLLCFCAQISTAAPPAETQPPKPTASPKTTVPSKTYHVAHTWSFEATPRYFWGRNDINQSFTDESSGGRALDNYLSPQLDSEYGALYLATRQAFEYRRPRYAGALVLMMDTGEIYHDRIETLDAETGMEETRDAWLTNGQTLGDEWRSTYFVRMLHLRQIVGKGKHLELALGKGNPVVGHGLIYNDYSPYAEVALDSRDAWSVPLRLEGMVLSVSNQFAPSQTNIGSLSFSLRSKVWGHFTMMTAHMSDTESGFASVFRRMITESVGVEVPGSASVLSGRPGLFNRTVGLTSSGSARWFGATYEKTWAGGHQFWCRGYLSRGRSTVTIDWSRFFRTLQRRMPRLQAPSDVIQQTVDIDMQGWAAHAGGYVFLGRDWYLYPYALAISGEDGVPNVLPQQNATDNGASSRYSYGGFLSVVPYLDSTNIFFNGGLAHSFSARQVSLPGLAGRGVAAAGFSFAGTVWRALSFQGGGSVLSSMHGSPVGGGTLYGVELNQGWTWTFPKSVSLSLQLDALRTGDFFRENVWNTQTTLQLSFSPSGTTTL